MKEVKKILLSARSPCSALSVFEIWKGLVDSELFEVFVAAQEPAVSILKNLAVPVICIEDRVLVNPDGLKAKKFLAKISNLLDEISPDSVIVGLSTPGEGGVDEAIIKLSCCKSYMVQDFWGDSNLFFGKHPDVYLVADREAERLTLARQGHESVIVGSLRHANYSSCNFSSFQALEECKKSSKAKKYVLGFFCQPIMLAGYYDTVALWAENVSNSIDCRVLYRPHPSSAIDHVDKVRRILSQYHLDYDTPANLTVEETIMRCSTIYSVMSNSMLDAAYMNYFSALPLAVPVYLLFNARIRKEMSVFCDLDNIPTVKQGVALIVKDSNNLEQVLKKSVDVTVRFRLWRKSKELPDPSLSVDKVISLVTDNINKVPKGI